MNDMKSMLNSAPPVRQYEACCAPERDPATVEFQPDRLREAVAAASNQAVLILDKIRGSNIPVEGDKPCNPGTVYEAVSMLAGEVETMIGDLNTINEIATRQLGKWRLE